MAIFYIANIFNVKHFCTPTRETAWELEKKQIRLASIELRRQWEESERETYQAKTRGGHHLAPNGQPSSLKTSLRNLLSTRRVQGNFGRTC